MPDASSAAKPQRQILPTDNLSARLQLLARLRQPAPPMPPNPRQQKGSAASHDGGQRRQYRGAGCDLPREGFHPRPGLAPFEYGCNARNAATGWWPSISSPARWQNQRRRIVSALDSDSAYRDFAISARDAVLLSPPLTLPPGATISPRTSSSISAQGRSCSDRRGDRRSLRERAGDAEAGIAQIRNPVP